MSEHINEDEAHIKKNLNRPQSKGGRPESSIYNSQNRKNNNQSQKESQQPNEKEEQQTQQIKPQQNLQDEQQTQKNKQIYQVLKKQSSQQQQQSQIIQKMSKFIAFHHISLQTFWKSQQIYVSFEQFLEFAQQIGMTILPNEYESLQQELQNNQGQITISVLCEKIKPWHNQENAMLEFIKEKVLHMAQNSKNKYRVSSQKGARQLTNSQKMLRPISSTTTEMNNNLKQRHQNQQEDQQNEEQNRSSQYLNMHVQRQRKIEEQLNEIITTNQSEQNYDALVKMGQANELAEQIGLTHRYRAFKRSDDNLIVRVYDDDQLYAELTINEFNREFTSLKMQHNQMKNSKIWEVLSENKKAIKGRDFSRNINKEDAVPIDQVDEQGGKKVKLSRQQELKRVLLETMWLSNIIKEQGLILSKKGINSNNQLNKSMTNLNNTKQSQI